MDRRYQKGVSLFMVLMVLAVMTSALLALLSILISQTKGLVFLSDSIIAFYAADTGVERVLYHMYQDYWMPTVLSECPYSWQYIAPNVTTTSYQVCVSDYATTAIWSTGRYNLTGTGRAIEINIK